MKFHASPRRSTRAAVRIGDGPVYSLAVSDGGDAQHVVVVDALDMAKLDPFTATMDVIRFGTYEFVPQPGVASYSMRWTFRRAL